MQMIARLLEMPSHIVDAIYQPLPSPSSPSAAKVQKPQAAMPGTSVGMTPTAGPIPGKNVTTRYTRYKVRKVVVL